MKLLLHIGSGKTGTSTLQATLRSHAKVLRRSGVLYPTPMFGKSNHNYVTALLHPMKDMPREFTSGGQEGLEAIRQRAEEFVTDVHRQVARSGAETVILSGEYFFGLSQQKLEGLRHVLREFRDVHVIAYVRHPTSFYVAWMQQIVKASSVIRPPSEFWFRPRASLSRYADVFGGELSVRSAHRDDLIGGCIVQDFMTSYVPRGAEIYGQLEVQDTNESMSAEAMCILQSLRRHGWPDEDGHFAAESTHVVTVLNAMRARWEQTPARLQPAIELAMTQRHEDDIAWLEATFGVRFPGSLPRPESAATDEPHGWTSQDLREILQIDVQRLDRTRDLLLRELAARSLA